MRGRGGGGSGAGLGARGMGAGGGGGTLRGPAAGKAVAADLNLANKASLAEWLALMKPYFAPKSAGHRAAAVACYSCLLLSKLCSISSPALLGLATDQIVRGNVPLGELCGFAGLRFLSSVFDELQRLLYLRVKETAALELDCRTFAHLHTLSYAWHVGKRTGVVLQAMNRGSSAASNVVEMLFLRLVPTILEMIVLVVIFADAYGSLSSSLMLLGSFIVYFVATYVLTTWRSKLQAKANLAGDDATAIATDSLVGFEVVKAFAAEAYELGRYSAASARMQQAGRQRQGSLIALNLVQSFIMRAALCGVLIFSAADVVAGRSSIGTYVALQTWTNQLFQPLAWLGSLYTLIQGALVDTLNLASLLKEEASVEDAPNALPLRLRDRGKGATVEMRGVSFAYPSSRDRIDVNMERQRAREKLEAQLAAAQPKPAASRLALAFVAAMRSATASILSLLGRPGAGGAVRLGEGDDRADDAAVSSASPAQPRPANNPLPEDATAVAVGGKALSFGGGSGGSAPRPILRNVSFMILPGKTTAIVGSTGSGKSTISRLLFRYFDAAEGSVLVDGQDVRGLQQTSLRAAIGIVPQDAVLFNESVRYNIAYGRPGANESEIVAAAKAAQIWPFIQSLAEGLDAKVGERGLKLSGGEKQRVAIARTLLKDPPILVLDEATSALDSITEGEVQEAISRAKQGRTVLVIAHRLSTVRDADEILVLESGSVVERGTHDALIEAHGRYFALWSQQAQSSLSAAGSAPPPAEAAAVGVAAPVTSTAVEQP